MDADSLDHSTSDILNVINTLAFPMPPRPHSDEHVDESFVGAICSKLLDASDDNKRELLFGADTPQNSRIAVFALASSVATTSMLRVRVQE